MTNSRDGYAPSSWNFWRRRFAITCDAGLPIEEKEGDILKDSPKVSLFGRKISIFSAKDTAI